MQTSQKQNTNVILRVIYTIFLAILISLFFGLGVSAFYPAPKAPTYPVTLEKLGPDVDMESDEVKNAKETYDRENEDFTKKNQVYNRNVSVITLALAVLSLAVSLIFLNKILLISDGLMLGGVFTLIYSIIRGFETQDAKYRFIIVTIGLAITLGLGYIKFIKPSQEKYE